MLLNFFFYFIIWILWIIRDFDLLLILLIIFFDMSLEFSVKIR